MNNATTGAGERLIIRRKLAAKRERVWRAFNDVNEAVQWSHPEGMSTKDFTADMRVGGAYRLTMVKPDGEEYIGMGVYREVTPPEKLVYTCKVTISWH
ncbi:MAG: SRPBCC domain-containing protein [Candidatus Eremiobacteraeota bacterium]|nr:SRPBCC domain-containing protein [Candidatus Eremiobacteraeota bacterium]